MKPIDPSRGPMRRLLPTIVGGILGAGLAACASTRPVGVVFVHTPAGAEQGVATQFGMVCLGKTARNGPCDVTVFYGDGPSSEPGTLQPIDAQLCGIQIELRAPRCEVSYTIPGPGDELVMATALDDDVDFWWTRLLETPGSTSLAIATPGGLVWNDALIGAPIYRREDSRYRLVGLVTGETTAAGLPALAFLGPRDLVPLAMIGARRDPRKLTPVRDDIVR